MNFVGQKCVCCGKVFEKNDDIVVCPECGSPHHRECYLKENRCANSAMHSTGEKWQRIEIEKDNEYQKSAFEKSQPEFDNYIHQIIEEDDTENNAGFNPDEDMGGATIKEIAMFVRTNTFYYIPIFKRMKDLGSKISFNFSCFVFPSFYFANRKMWFWAVISALIGVIFDIPSLIIIMSQQEVFKDNIMSFIYQNQNFIEELANICMWGSWISRILMCIFANWIYFRFAIKKLRIIKKSGTLNPYMLIAFGGVKPMNIILITLITMSLTLVSVIGIMFFLSSMAM